jgi:hypothetical protein
MPKQELLSAHTLSQCLSHRHVRRQGMPKQELLSVRRRGMPKQELLRGTFSHNTSATGTLSGRACRSRSS